MGRWAGMAGGGGGTEMLRLRAGQLRILAQGSGGGIGWSQVRLGFVH